MKNQSIHLTVRTNHAWVKYQLISIIIYQIIWNNSNLQRDIETTKEKEKEKVSLIARSKHWLRTQPLMTEVSTNFSDNISNFWNNFKPQSNIETAKERKKKKELDAQFPISVPVITRRLLLT